MAKSRQRKQQMHTAKVQRKRAKHRAMMKRKPSYVRPNPIDEPYLWHSFLHTAPPPAISIMDWLARQRTARQAA